MTKRVFLYYNNKSGDVQLFNKSQAKHAGSSWERVEFTKNDKGVDVMRMRMENGITVDISERETKEADNVDANAN